MKKFALISLLLIGTVLFGCTGTGPQQPSVTPSVTLKPQVSIPADYETDLTESEQQLDELNKLTKELDESGMDVTDDEMESIG